MLGSAAVSADRHSLRQRSGHGGMTKRNVQSKKMAESRARLGEQQRGRSRAAIIDAALRVFQEKSPDAAVIGDFIAEAGVARGTFYNHFRDVEDVLVAVAARLGDEFNNSIRAAYANVRDPAQRIAIAVRHFLHKTTEDPNWGRLLVRVALRKPMEDILRSGLEPDLCAGREAGRLTVNQACGADIVLGTVHMAMRTLLSDDAPTAHSEDVAAAILRALGLNAVEANEIAHSPLPALGR